jgi:hypothetical protein
MRETRDKKKRVLQGEERANKTIPASKRKKSKNKGVASVKVLQDVETIKRFRPYLTTPTRKASHALSLPFTSFHFLSLPFTPSTAFPAF